MHNVLLVEDDKNFGQILKDYLEMNNFQVKLATDGNQGYTAIHQGVYDICILDVMLPYKDGYSLAEEITKHKPGLPFIFLTAKTMKEDTIKGFKLGADDFLNKPFDAEVLLYKLKAVLGRKGKAKKAAVASYQIGDYSFSPDMRKLGYGDETITLSPKEADVLEMLCEGANSVVLRSVVLENIWGEDSYFNGRSMDVYIAKLRKHLKKDDQLEILTIHGKGFRLNVPVN